MQPFDPASVIAEFCQIYGIPFHPPEPDPEADTFHQGVALHAWLREQCDQFGVTYPFDQPGESAMEDYKDRVRQHRASLRAQVQQELDQTASEIDHATRSCTPSRQDPAEASKLKLPLAQIRNEARASKTKSRCEHRKASGKSCKRPKMHGDSFCYQHSPDTRELARATSSNGGRKNRGSIAAAEIPIELANAGGVQAAITAAVRLFAAGNFSHRQVLSFTRLMNLAVRNVRANPRQVDYLFHAEQLQDVLDDVEVALQVSEMHDRQAEIAEHRQRINAVAEIAAEHGLKPRATPTLPRK